MSKRRINKQQLNRIEKKQKMYRQQEDCQNDLLSDGLVIARYSKHALVEDQQGNTIHCSIRPSIESLVAGDRVVWQPEGEHQGIIVSRHNRQSILGRPDNHGNIKAVAANITQIIIVIAPSPEISWSLLDSYLVMAEHLNIHPYILLNKTDIACDEIQKTLLKYYEPLGYPILFTSKTLPEDKSLEKALNNQINVLVGQSGVGKSSIIARILPNESDKIATGKISEHSSLGCHTTSNSKFYHLPNGGALIDSPGIRELSLWSMPGDEIAKGYREFKSYIPQCKFRNCTHIDTPGCAVINAVKNKLIHLKRYENYVKMLQQ
ncbi:MAG: small ribosomal subunit biogenesis GTPase RsgA [Legionellaceae bacterium]|nr:small ribosomal subunit biogenesis GTPase RsgA [Legionellaceae bacterium]